jgi:hypothetical protein
VLSGRVGLIPQQGVLVTTTRSEFGVVTCNLMCGEDCNLMCGEVCNLMCGEVHRLNTVTCNLMCGEVHRLNT